MKTPLAAALLLSAALASIAIAQDKLPGTPQETGVVASPIQAAPAGSPESLAAPDARTLAGDAEVGEARRAYRAACQRHETASFCDCVTAGVAQALMPSEVRIAARTFGERIPAQGDTIAPSDSDNTVGLESSAARIEQVEAHYTGACAAYR